MKRIITYLYEYQNGMRRGSAGVFKLDLLGEECRIQLNLQGSVPVEEQGTVYFVVKHGEGDLTGVLVGETSRYRGSGGGNWAVRQKGICGSRYSFDDVHGMAVRYPSGRYLASCWEEKADEQFLRGDFAEEKEQTEKADERFLRGNFEEEKQTEKADERSLRSDFIEQKSTGKTEDARKSEAAEYMETAEYIEAAENPRVVEGLEDDECLETDGALEVVLSSETAEPIETVLDSKPIEPLETALNMRNVEDLEAIEDDSDTVGEWKPDGNLEISKKTGKIIMKDGDRDSAEKQEENVNAQEMAESSLETERDTGGLHAEELPNTASKEILQRMDISDIRSLPKKNWHLCSNSFLIHGFFSYHYLVRKDVEEDGVIKSYLGVPGIYARPERAMAMLFGFPEFEIERRSANNKKNTIAKGQTINEHRVVDDRAREDRIKEDRARENNTEEIKGKESMAGEVKGANSKEPRIPEGTFGYWFCQIEV